MKKIAVTGGLSSGKSTVCRLLAELGAFVVSADEIVHNLLSSDPNVRRKVVDLLGADVLINNQLNREAIAEKVFSHPATLRSLESLLHPLVFHEIESRYNIVKHNTEYSFFAAEVPLLYETKTEDRFDAIVVVSADEMLCKERFLKEKKQTPIGFSERMSRQIPVQEKIGRADFILVNNGNLADLKKEVVKFVHKLHPT